MVPADPRSYPPWSNVEKPGPSNELMLDSLTLIYPWRSFNHWMLRQGKIPLWNPYNFCGVPQLAQIQPNTLYPLVLPFDFWLDDFVEIVGSRGILWINQCSAAGDRELFRGNEMSTSPVFPPIAMYVNGKVDVYDSSFHPVSLPGRPFFDPVLPSGYGPFGIQNLNDTARDLNRLV